MAANKDFLPIKKKVQRLWWQVEKVKNPKGNCDWEPMRRMPNPHWKCVGLKSIITIIIQEILWMKWLLILVVIG